MLKQHIFKRICTLGLLILFSLLSACTHYKQVHTGFSQQSDFALKTASYKSLPGWGNDDLKPALIAFQHSCSAFMKKPDHAPISVHGFAGAIKDWKPICHAANGIDPEDNLQVQLFFEDWFRPVQVQLPNNAPGLFTGYFEPTIKASRKRHGKYQYPIYARPPDLITVNLGKFQSEYAGRTLAGRIDHKSKKFVPYYSRAEIKNGALAGKGLEILWCDNPVDTFFLEIQGSGRATLDTGETVRVLYEAKNGLSYTPIGKVLVAKGHLEPHHTSMQAIREFLGKHPHLTNEILNTNQSYVFFRLGEEPHVYGSQNVPLTAERSLAIDQHYLPLGIPIWLNTKMPADHNPRVSETLQRLMIAQDTGGMIRGPIRGDIFWGNGDMATLKAGHMKYEGHYWLLLPKSIPL